ncbi:MAG: cytochrome c biogenesis CcdA family protein [Anaerolineae bacterium]
MEPQKISIFLALAAGLLSFISPCVLPMVPAYMGYLSGTAVETAEGVVISDRRATFLHALSFVLGFGSVFTLLGASVGLIGYVLYDVVPLAQKVGGVLVIILGLHTMGVLKIPFLYQSRQLSFLGNPKLGYLSSYLIGAVFATGWTPCIGVVLSGILLLASTSQTVARGALLLAVYSAGLGVPFLIVGLGLDRMGGALRRLNRHARVVEVVSGLFLVAIGIMIYTNFLGYLSIYFFRLLGPVPFL